MIFIHLILSFFIALALAMPGIASADADSDDWLVLTVGSRHHKRGYNEHNYGIGIEHGIAENWRVVAGTYRNSYYRQTVYAGTTYLPLRYENWRIGGAALIVTGYDPRPSAAVFPMVSYEEKKWGLNFGPVLPSVIAVQVKLKL
jgi:hypothetical protein